MAGRTVETDVFDPTSGQPWRPSTVRARAGEIDLAEWLEPNLETARELLARGGAIRLRGMRVGTDTFGHAVSLLAGAPLMDYLQRSTPRRRVEGNVFTSTEYRADQVIPMHSEQSYGTSWPKYVGFWCRQPATTGGQTPLAPTADILDHLPAELVKRFDAGGVRYERWYQPFVDLPWQDVFQTDDPSDVDRVCRESGIEATWYDGGVLHTSHSAQATILHRPSGRRVWFNQACLFHSSALPPAVREMFRARFGERLPRNAFLGDGSPITADEIAEITAAIERVTWREAWEADEVVVVDNEAVAHGRAGFTGSRSVLVAMAGVGGAGE